MKRFALLPLSLVLACATTNETTRSDEPSEPVTSSDDAPAGDPAAEKAAWNYPPTRADGEPHVLHGVTVNDPYQWLEEEKSDEVQAWMKTQDGFARAHLSKLPGRDLLKDRFTELFYMESTSVPVYRLIKGKDGKQAKRYFFQRTHKDKEKAVLYVRDGDGDPRVLLDPNTWSKDQTVSLGPWDPSWDGQKVVFKKKPNAADEATLHVVDVGTGEWSKVDVIDGAKYADPSWTPDSKGFYYEWLPTDPSIKVDERPGYTELRYHALGTDPKTDVQVHPRTGDPKTFLGHKLSRDGNWLQVYVIRGWTENDIYLKRVNDKAPQAKDSGKGFTLLVKGDGAKYDATVWKDSLYVLTDEGAPNQRVFRASMKAPARKNWKELVPEDKAAKLETGEIVGGMLSFEYLVNASSELRVHSLDGKFAHKLQLPGIGNATVASGLKDVDEAYFEFSSFTIPRQVYKTSVASGKTELWAKVELPIDPSPYTVEQVWYPSKDGTKVSMFLVHRKDLKKDGQNPVLLYGYGGFDVSLVPSFKATLYPWLEAGGVYAVANLRGGGEYGKTWHEAGRLGRKQNVFDDFIAAGEYLVKAQYTRPEKLAIWGGSNGGLLVGAAMVQRPDLYGAVVCAVPLLDMVRYHLFGSGRTWIPEYGTAEDPEQFKYLHAYSPYHHVKEGTDYPAMLMLASDHDDRVDPMHARKFTAAVQTATAGDAPAIIRIEKNAGHGGADQVRQSIALYSDMFAFLMARFGMTPEPSAPSVNPAANAQ